MKTSNVAAMNAGGKERRFPLMNEGCKYAPDSVPWSWVAPHNEQAERNHSQTLERLAERGGLGISELLAVVENRRYRSMTTEEMLKGFDEWRAHKMMLSELVQAMQVVNLLDELRGPEGSGNSVTILCVNDNPPPNQAVICLGDWTGHDRATGPTLQLDSTRHVSPSESGVMPPQSETSGHRPDATAIRPLHAWEEERFEGETLLAALTAAVKAKREREAKGPRSKDQGPNPGEGQ
jgi:hypothetical protein